MHDRPVPGIHDVTTGPGQAALFGFAGIAAGPPTQIGKAAPTAACIGQFVRIFGAEAAHPQTTMSRDWAADPWTATSADLEPADHPASAEAWLHGPWQEHLMLAESEIGPGEAGYLAGAAEASAKRAAEVSGRFGSREAPA